MIHAPQEHAEALGKISSLFSVLGVPKTIAIKKIIAVKQLTV